MAWFFGLGLLIGLLFLWGNSRAAKLVLPQPDDLETALAAVLRAEPQQEAWLLDQLEVLTQMGWPQASQVAFLSLIGQEKWSQAVLVDQVSVFASPVFIRLFQAGLTDQAAARQLLALSLDLLAFPEDLTGRPSQVTALLGRIWPDLPPHDGFWAVLAQAVELAFPGQALLVEEDRLGRRVHQLRYLLSTYQADWVRRTYGGPGLNDRQALVAYLAQADARDRLGEWLGLTSYDYQLTYDLGESSRLHNKRGPERAGSGAQRLFPDDRETINLKILINYHTEFILSSQGNLINLMERWEAGANGVLNGASFNYANKLGRRHQELDVAPVRVHDPAFRRRLLKGFRSPKPRRLPMGRDWRESFYNAKGAYALGHQSCYQAVQAQARALTQEINQVRIGLAGK